MKRHDSMSDLNSTRLRELLDYNQSTGEFTWKVTRGRMAKAGGIAGAKHGENYILIMISGRTHKAHRLAWMYVYGDWPVGFIDHINGVRHDNRISNLRDVTRSENMQNQRKPRRKNPYIGASWCKRRKLWIAQINVNGGNKFLGYYEKAEEAHAAYVAAKRIHHTGCAI
jgi:hypothetical protein